MIADFVARLRAIPLAAVLELGSLFVCVLLFVGTLGLLSSGPPTGRGDLWLALIGLGAAFVVFWTVLVPLYERTL
ncbi:hypothetical protein [Natronorubrum sulfidifaciens]|uniref:Uncharacterized protein n=1 Tax=Natronorubrum sulfidifaciens JCM 14089 TaxID=1230460 RepID=L9W8M0_9EURY|nr:hypothetical protein [Natronorubrum sulfidifaciens]ELY45692.1 hypothetical protein C495_07925 [Natronorubrum sulfidifaciens JCM 14089]